MKDEFAYIRLLDAYAPLLTDRQRTIAELYFTYDLSLGEIAEQTEVSRQSVYDCLQTIKRTLTETEEKLGFCRAAAEQEEAIRAYVDGTDKYLEERLGEGATEVKEALARLRKVVGVEG